MSIQERAYKAASQIMAIVLKHPELYAQAAVAITDEMLQATQSPELIDIWDAMSSAFLENKQITTTGVWRYLRSKGVPNSEQLLANLLSNPPFISSREMVPAIDELRDAALRWRISQVASDLQRIAEDEGLKNDSEVSDAARTSILPLLISNREKGPVHISEPVQRLVDDMKARREGKPPLIRRIRWGFPKSIDYTMSSGFAAGQLVVLAARTNMGKSALALTAAMNVAEEYGPVFYISAEMDKMDLAMRLVQADGHMTSEIWEREPSQEQVRRAEAVLEKWKKLPLEIYDFRPIAVDQIPAVCHVMAMRAGKPAMIVVDHLHNLSVPADARRYMVAYLGQMARQLRDLGQEFGAVVLLLCQINRRVEGAHDKRPTMADLRESGQIEEVADVILLMYRHKYYHRGNGNGKVEIPDICEVEIAKNRMGKTGRTLVKFEAEYTRFVDPSKDEKDLYERLVLSKHDAGNSNHEALNEMPF